MAAFISDYIFLKMADYIRLYLSVKWLIPFQIIFICKMAAIISDYIDMKIATIISDYIYFKMGAIISDYI